VFVSATRARRTRASDGRPAQRTRAPPGHTRLVEQHHDDPLRVADSLLQRHTTTCQLVRALRSHSRHLASLAPALQHAGTARQDDPPAGLLHVNAIVLYDTIYTQRALDHLVASSLHVDDVDVERLSPLGSNHLTLTGAPASPWRDRSAYREAGRCAPGTVVVARTSRSAGRSVRDVLSTYRPATSRLPPDFVPLFLTGRVPPARDEELTCCAHRAARGGAGE
jgi:hypothetical protein